MPIYEYRCTDCGFQKEYLQKVSEPPRSVCPSCSKTTFVKMLTAAGFQLKGSGWYATDFKSTAKPKAAEGKAEAKADSAADAKADAKPAATEAKSDAKADTAGATGSKSAAPAVG